MLSAALSLACFQLHGDNWVISMQLLLVLLVFNVRYERGKDGSLVPVTALSLACFQLVYTGPVRVNVVS